MKKRTNWDFSEHTHRVEIFKSSDGNEIRVDHLQKGNSNMGYVKFVNDSRGLSVFGDFGNWIFCRPFHPSADGFVSDYYWCEKLSISSSQVYSKYDSKATAEELEQMINKGLENYGYREEELEKAKEWFQELLENVDNELDYTYAAYRGDNPTEIDYENIPFVKEISVQLKIVFDAFDWICHTIKTQEKEYEYSFTFKNSEGVLETKVVKTNKKDSDLAISTFEKQFPNTLWRKFDLKTKE